MLNLLSYVGLPLQSELCFWNMLGLVTTIFDATLFKVNANLKQVWAMEMPSELTMPVQRGLRTMISGIMLVQCFTVYVYLASYIVMLYPIYLEERPSLLLPWLLLAAVRKLLCELISLALGLGTCVLVGPTRTACIKFVISKISSLLPSFYMWMLVFSFYSSLKITGAFVKYPVVRPSSSDQDYSLELAVRRRRTKSLQDEEQLRMKLLQTFGSANNVRKDKSEVSFNPKRLFSSSAVLSDVSVDGFKKDNDMARPFSVASNTEYMEDWFGSEIAMPRDSDRVVNQFSLMLLRIGAFINSGESDTKKFLLSQYKLSMETEDNINLLSEDPSDRLSKSLKRSSYPSTYRNSEVPTVKSTNAIVSIDMPRDNATHSPKETHEHREDNSQSSTTDHKRKSKESINLKRNSSRWDRLRQAKLLKLYNISKARRSKHTTKVKVSQSIIDLIEHCKKEVKEKLKLKTEIDYKTYVDLDTPETSLSRNLNIVYQSTRSYIVYQRTVTIIFKLKKRESGGNSAKREYHVGVSTYDKNQPMYNNASSKKLPDSSVALEETSQNNKKVETSIKIKSQESLLGNFSIKSNKTIQEAAAPQRSLTLDEGVSKKREEETHTGSKTSSEESLNDKKSKKNQNTGS